MCTICRGRNSTRGSVKVRSSLQNQHAIEHIRRSCDSLPSNLAGLAAAREGVKGACPVPGVPPSFEGKSRSISKHTDKFGKTRGKRVRDKLAHMLYKLAHMLCGCGLLP